MSRLRKGDGVRLESNENSDEVRSGEIKGILSDSHKQVWIAAKGAWKLAPELTFVQLLVSAVAAYKGAKPADFASTGDEILLKALDSFSIKRKKILERRRGS